MARKSIRALIFDLKGNLLAKSKIEFEPYFSDKPGWAEQKVESFWQNLALCCQQLWQQADVIKHNYQKKISAVSLTTQRGSVINLDNIINL